MIKLTNGDWVNPECVVAIQQGQIERTRVFIILDANSNLLYEFSSEDDAKIFRDENALLISGVETTVTRVD